MTRGEIVIAGKIVNNLTPKDRNIAMVFQSYALYPHMTVAENMSFNLKLSRKPKEAIQLAVGEAARMLGLEDLLQRRPAHLSGGQRQRVAMGRAVVRKPAVFLFDEPLSNLDAKLRVQMRAEIKILHQRVGTTSIYVTHDQIEAMTLADRIVVLNAGRIEQVGTPLDLYRNPANLFVAGFIGSPAMNFLDAVIRRQGVTVAQFADGSTVELPDGMGVADGQEVVIGLRPENLVLAGPGTAISGPVRLFEPTGAQTHVLFSVAGKDIVALVDGATPIANGQTLTVHVPPGQVHVFGRDGGQRVS